MKLPLSKSPGPCLAVAALLLLQREPQPAVAATTWETVAIAGVNAGPEQTASQVFDIDKDGVLDFVLAERTSAPAVAWYKRAGDSWQKFIIEKSALRVEAGGAHHDIDGDGDLDLVFGGDAQSNEIWWWENPFPDFAPVVPWKRHLIKASGGRKHHDSMFGDFDGDGVVEFVTWNQGARQLLMAEIPSDPTAGRWEFIVIDSPGANYEGLAKADIDGDGVVDIVGGGSWYKFLSPASFSRQPIDATQGFTRAAVGQLIPGGRPEVVFVPGDADGPLYLYQWTGDGWKRTALLDGTRVLHGHSLDIGDINGDGDLDIFVAEMGLTAPKPRMWVLLGDGTGRFQASLLSSSHANHESRVADLDGDGDLDILQKPFRAEAPGATVWINTTSPLLDLWRRHVIDDARPWRSLFVTASDLDNDGNSDIITGGWWYQNPGAPGGTWIRNAFGAPLNNIATVYDFDGDGDLDVLGTQAKGADANSRFAWGRNDGAGTFTVLTNISSGDGDFLQGVATAVYRATDGVETALSWHAAGKGIQILTTPGDSSSTVWPWRKISTKSQDEQISAGDIDRDGDLDLLLGTTWLRNDGEAWTAFPLHATSAPPDRNRLADINGDGRLDAVVGYEAISRNGKVAWYEQPAVATDLWIEHVVADVIGPMSLDVGDLDRDGDIDLVVGEHNLAKPAEARLYVFENLDGAGLEWTEHLVHTGDEHHDGAQLADIDNDRDLDIISIGWGHNDVVLYENKAVPAAVSRITNFSMRAVAGRGGSPLIIGFVVGGSGRDVLVRAIGPSLVSFGVTGFLPNPRIELHATVNGVDQVVASNDDWAQAGAETLRVAFAGASAFPLDATSLDAALIMQAAGARTVHTVDTEGRTGVALVEVYDLSNDSENRIINISGRNFVGTGEQILIAGLVISGSSPKRLLIRGIGPGLTPFGVPNILTDPQIEVHASVQSGSGPVDTVIANNDDWAQTGVEALQAAFASTGAFPLTDPTSRDAALVIELDPGAYTVWLNGKDGGTGEGLIEFYELR